LKSSATITGTLLPAGPATPSNPAWGATAYRDIPWWFTDSSGAADAFDISAIWATRFNKNNTGGYEAAIINTPAPTGSAYGAAGGAFGTAADVTWGRATWNFTLNYSWNNGAPTGSLTYQNGATTATTGNVSLGSRVIDFVQGNVTRPLTGTGTANPFTESHNLNDMLMRFATINTDGTATQMDSITVGNMAVSVDGGAYQGLNYYDANGSAQTAIITEWNAANGINATTNPRQIQFLYFDNILPSYQSSLTVTGQLAFDYTGSTNIAGSGLMFEVKLGDLNYFPGAEPFAVVPEPASAGLGALGLLLIARRRR